jgi:hypothetical protein
MNLRLKTLLEQAEDIRHEAGGMKPTEGNLRDKLYDLAELCVELAHEVQKLKEATFQTKE